MRNSRTISSLVPFFLCSLVACGSGPEESRQAPEAAGSEPAPPVEIDQQQLEADLLAIGASYQEFGRLDDEGRWAPWLCRMPRPASGRISTPEEGPGHGRKLYTLYAKDAQAYAGFPASFQELPASLNDFEQVIVKESFRPVPYEGEFDPEQPMAALRDWGPQRLQPAERDGQLWAAGERTGLFVMYRPPAGTAGTDAGWFYGVLGADGERIEQAGRIESCMQCHEQAGPTRLFGWEGEAPEGF